MDEIGSHLGWLQLAWEIAFAVGLGLVGVYSRHIRGLKRRQAQLEEKLATTREGLTRLEERCLKSEDLSNIHRRVDSLTESVHGMSGELRALSSNVALIHDYLLNKKD